MSTGLPTPPRTSQKDKENLPPTPLTPSNSNASSRTPRIVWSQENLHHAYSTQIRQLPASSFAKVPPKSILKKPSLPLIPLIAMLNEQATREVTPEPADPLHHPLYLNSPVSTLVASLRPGNSAKITLTDLTEAYSVLSARLKTKTHAMLETCGPIPALEPLREHRNKLVEAFHRDLGRALVNPQSSPPPLDDSPWSSPSSVGSIKKRGYTEQEVKHARDLCNLCHAALRCFSNIALVPVLYCIFNDTQLGDMLTDVLAIPLATSLPTPNARKTWQIAVWTLQIQRLPTAVLAPAANRIAYVLRRGMDGELGREGKKGAASDGLKAIATLVAYQPTIFVPSFVDILPSVFTNLTSQNPTLRVQAAHAILALAHALARLPIASHASFAQATSTYIAEQHQMRKTPQDASPLSKAIRASLDVETPLHAAQSPMWALSVIAALIVLSGGDALTRPRTIKFVLGHLQTAMAVKRTTVRATSGLVWRALVWACVRLDGGEQTREQRQAGWKVVRQILDGAIGISVIAALVGQKQRKEDKVPQALECVKTMIKKGGKTCEEAVDVLERLLSGVGSGVDDRRDGEWTNERLLVEPLFNGTLLQVEWKALVSHVKDAMNRCVGVQDVRPLREDEVVQNWDALFAIWKEAVERAPLGEDGEVPPALLSAWQALLLTQAQLTQDYEDLTSAPAFILHLTALLTSFLTDASLEWSLDAGAPSWSSQPLKLGFVRNLWSVARNVFAAPVLAGAAQTLLHEVLGHKYFLGQDEVKDAWAALCAELVLAGAPELVRELWEVQEQGLEEVKQNLWRVVSQRWVEDAGPWEGAIGLLRAPFALPMDWELGRNDLDLWVRVVDCALLAASTRKISPTTVLDTIAHEIGTGHNHGSLYATLPYLLSGVDASAPEHPPVPQHPRLLLTLVNDVLVAGYPPSDAGDKSMLLDVVESLAEIVKIACKELLVEFLVQVQDGIGAWMQDQREVFADKEYNQQIIPFYLAALEALTDVPPSSETLCAITPLLISAFGHIPKPALGPSAFKVFWIKTYQPLGERGIDYPENLKPVLRTVQETMCAPEDILAHGLSLETQTQDLGTTDLPLSVVPDSLESEDLNAVDAGDGSEPVPVLAMSPVEPNEQQRQTGVDDTVRRSDFGSVTVPREDTDAPHSEFPDSPGTRGASRASYGIVKSSRALLDGKARAESLKSSHATEALPTAPAPMSYIPYSTQAPIDSGNPILQHAPSVPLRISRNPSASSELGPSNPLSRLSAGPETLACARVAQSVGSIKEEEIDLHSDVMMPDSSQSSNASRQSRSSAFSLGKRKRSRILLQSSKRCKLAATNIEIINISDDEDSEQVALDLSIVVAPTKPGKSLDTHEPALLRTSQPSTPKSVTGSSAPTSNPKKRSFFEAVELPKLQELKKRLRLPPPGAPSKSSPELSFSKKNIITRQVSKRLDLNELDAVQESPSPLKRLCVTDSSRERKHEILYEWSDDTPPGPVFYGSINSIDTGSDDTDTNETPLQRSDRSIPSSLPGRISASHIISPLLRRSRSEAYDPPSDDTVMSSSPLKQATARRLERARTAPVLFGSASHTDMLVGPHVIRTSSEEFLALKHAHVVITSGASKMGLQELLEASKMVNKISGTLSDEMTKKLGGCGSRVS